MMNKNKITKLEELEDFQARFLIRCNAFLTNPELSQGYFSEIYGKDVTLELILRMNPGNPDLCILSDDLKEYWQAMRELVIKSLKELPIADFMVRMAVFSEMYEILRGQDNYELIIELLSAVRAETEAVYRAHAEQMRMRDQIVPGTKVYEA